MAVCIRGRVKQGLGGCSDSDLGGDIDTRKSTSGILYFLGDNVITWQFQKPMVVALSSCEAEYIAATTAACQGVAGKATCRVQRRKASHCHFEDRQPVSNPIE
jgi:hypothetical protein